MDHAHYVAVDVFGEKTLRQKTTQLEKSNTFDYPIQFVYLELLYGS